jgi:hypothetical protein
MLIIFDVDVEGLADGDEEGAADRDVKVNTIAPFPPDN